MLLVLPGLFVHVLLGVDITGSGVVISRLFGLALLSFGLACWPHGQAPSDTPGIHAIRVLLLYNGLATVYLGYLRTLGRLGRKPPKLLPCFSMHLALAIAEL
jgi:hypothetical protein